jgi:hypothetical protein
MEHQDAPMYQYTVHYKDVSSGENYFAYIAAQSRELAIREFYDECRHSGTQKSILEVYQGGVDPKVLEKYNPKEKQASTWKSCDESLPGTARVVYALEFSGKIYRAILMPDDQWLLEDGSFRCAVLARTIYNRSGFRITHWHEIENKNLWDRWLIINACWGNFFMRLMLEHNISCY